MARLAPDPTLAYVRCAVSIRRSTLIEAMEIMDRDETDPGVMRVQVEIETCAWVLGLIEERPPGPPLLPFAPGAGGWMPGI